LTARCGILQERAQNQFREKISERALEMSISRCTKNGLHDPELTKESNFCLTQILPTSEALLEQMFEGLTEHLTQYIETTFPDGVAGMDAYDDVLPDGLPSYAEFLESVEAKHEEFKAKNPEAIPGAIEEVKATSKLMFQDVVNKAISAAMEEIALDLSDDTLPYLDEDQMQALRDDLITDSNEYCASRMVAE